MNQRRLMIMLMSVESILKAIRNYFLMNKMRFLCEGYTHLRINEFSNECWVAMDDHTLV